MILGFKDPNKYVYHYTRMDTALEYILPSSTLMANKFSSTNDPKESRQWHFNLGTNKNRDLAKYDMDELSHKLSSALKARTKVLCFCKDQPDLTGDHLRDIYKRGFCKPRMWAQYADNHSGVCLVFDRQKLDRTIRKQFSSFSIFRGDVSYKNPGVVGFLHEGDYKINVDYLEEHGFDHYASAHFQTFHKRLFFQKLLDWINETEYRWVIATDVTEPIYVDVQDSLVGIVFGDNAEEDSVDKVIGMTDYRILYAGLKWKNCSPWYDFANFKYDKDLRDSPWNKPRQ